MRFTKRDGRVYMREGAVEAPWFASLPFVVPDGKEIEVGWDVIDATLPPNTLREGWEVFPTPGYRFVRYPLSSSRHVRFSNDFEVEPITLMTGDEGRVRDWCARRGALVAVDSNGLAQVRLPREYWIEDGYGETSHDTDWHKCWDELYTELTTSVVGVVGQ